MQRSHYIPTRRALALPFAAVWMLTCTLGVPFARAQAEGAAEGAAGLLEVEAAKRLAATQEAQELLRKGDEAYGEENFELALEIYGGVRGMLPEAPVTQELRDAATERFAVASVAQAQQKLAVGDLAAASALLEAALAEGVAPNHPQATAMLKRLKDPVSTNPALNKAHGDNVNRVLELLILAESEMALGKFDEAARSYGKILNIDAYNKAARRGMEAVLKAKGGSSAAAYDQTRAEMLSNVDRAWELPLEAEDQLPQVADWGGQGDYVPQTSLRAKVDRIFIPRIAFDGVNIEEALEFLRAESINRDTLSLDAESRGVNFTLNLSDVSEETQKQIRSKRFDLQVTNIPLSEALRFIAAKTGTAYSVEDYAVVIKPRGYESEELVLRTHRVPPNFISALSAGSGGGGGAVGDPFADDSGAGLLTVRKTAKEVLEAQGVTFANGSTVSYNPSSNSLRVLNTARNQDLIEQIVRLVTQTEPVVVSVQVTIIRTQQSNLKELGYDWLISPVDMGDGGFLGGGTDGSMPGRTGSDFSSVFPGALAPDQTVSTGVVTNGLRSGDQGFTNDKLGSIIGDLTRDTQRTQVAPGVLALTGIFSDGQAQLVLRGLDQKKGVDLMANPSVITKSGQSSKIDLVREFIYPTEYDPPELQQGGGGGGNQGGVAFPVVPANPTAFEMREVGISLEVVPVANTENNYIDVTLNPSIVDLEGFVNFGSPINTAFADGDGNPVQVTLTENQILMPVFSTQRVTTQLSVADGATVAFGGLMTDSIEAFEDKVPIIGSMPFIGRFFSSAGSRPVSTAVIFLVKVDLMDPTGRLYRDR